MPVGELNSRVRADVAQDAARAAPREPRAQWLCADDEVPAAATSAFEAVDDDEEERSGDRAEFEEMAFELDSLPCSTEIEMDCLHSEGGVVGTKAAQQCCTKYVGADGGEGGRQGR